MTAPSEDQLALQRLVDHFVNKPGADSTSIRREVTQLYNTVNSTAYNPESLSLDEEQKIMGWLNWNMVLLGFRTERYFKRKFFLNEPDKVDFVSQTRCPSCEPGYISFFPIRISPRTRQTTTRIKNAFQKLIRESPYVAKKRFKKEDRICLKLVFVVRKSRKEMDLDNMAKITLDGLKGVLFPDDKQIDHLNLVKFRAKYLEEFILVSIGYSSINQGNDFIFTNSNLGFGGLEKLVIPTFP